MRKALVIPKAVLAVICLAAAVVVSLPVFPFMMNRMFGGGTIDLNEAEYVEYKANKPISGDVTCVLGASAGESGTYYYLIPLKGSAISKENNVDRLVLVKVPQTAESYEKLNDVLRDSKTGDPSARFKISGCLRSMSAAESDIAKKIQHGTSYRTYYMSEYQIDLTHSIAALTGRFLLSLVAYALCAFFVVLTVQAVRKNADIERIEDERFAYKLEQDRKSGNKNEDGSDKMFGDSDASYGVTPQAASTAGSYEPKFQSQGNSDDDPFAGSMLGGSSGGGFLDDSDDFADNPAPDFLTGSQPSERTYDEDGFFGGGGSADDGGFFGGR